MKIFSLFEWVPEQSDTLSTVLRCLKGHQQAPAWQFWADAFWKQRVCNLDSGQEFVFIPAPGSRSDEGVGKDHAYLFAEALCKLSGGELLNPLKKMTPAHQKEKNREQREQVFVQSSINISLENPHKRYIFCDDVLTTGATALASHSALGKPVNFEVWTLGKRGLACGVSVDLL